MRFMNDWDRERAISRFIRSSKPNRLGVAYVVSELADWADANSDGWAYWPAPCRAAKKAILLIDPTTNEDEDRMVRTDATDAEVKAALAPIKAFLTKQAKETNRFGNPRVSAEDRERILRGGQVIA